MVNSPKKEMRDFPSGPMVKTLPPKAGVADTILDWEVKIPHALQPITPNIFLKKKKQYCNKFNKAFKIGPYKKSFKKIKKKDELINIVE